MRNGVANSTVFGGISGDTMAAWVRREGAWREPDAAAIEQSIGLHDAPFRHRPGSTEPIREELYTCMWEDAGILRTHTGCGAPSRGCASSMRSWRAPVCRATTARST